MPENKKDINSQLEGTKKLVEQSCRRTKLAEKNTQLSIERTYTNYERTLSVWVRTALAAMAFGIAVDRLGEAFNVSLSSTIAGSVLIVYSMIIALVAAIRFIKLTRKYQEEGYDFMKDHKVWLPTTYAFMVVFFGAVLLVIMTWII